MINTLSIKNFKSIEGLNIDCRKINVFIGEPNTGKSNILEALGFFSPGFSNPGIFRKLFRFKTITDLFFDFDFNKPIRVETDEFGFELSLKKTETGNLSGEFAGYYYIASTVKKENDNEKDRHTVSISHSGDILNSRPIAQRGPSIRTYNFERPQSFNESIFPFLSPPAGDNLPRILGSNPELRKTISTIYREKGFRLQLKPVENDMSISKEVDDELYSYPYFTTSETLQRITFMIAAMDSNKNASLVFDEPESNTFPFYTKFIAENIARDESNQFFISTHNPYLLMSIIEKTKLDALQIFICKMENYKTLVAPMDRRQIEEALDYGPDIFFNLDKIAAE